MSEVLALLESLRLEHYVNEDDPWYSCPESGTCPRDTNGESCDCGANEHNATLDRGLGMIREGDRPSGQDIRQAVAINLAALDANEGDRHG